MKEFLGEAGRAERREFPEEKPKARRRRRREQGERRQGKKQKKKRRRSRRSKSKPAGSDELVPAAEAGYAEGKIVARKVGGGFPVFYPTRLPSGAAFVESNPYEHVVDPRVYHLKDKDKERHAAYRMVGVYQPEYEVAYFGIQGIRGWEDPPILDRSDRNEGDPRPRVRHLRRRRQGDDGRLAPRRKHLLGLQQPAETHLPTTR